MMNDLFLLFICWLVLIVVLNLLIVIVGLVVLSGLEVREFFDVDIFIVMVIVFYFGVFFEIVDVEVISCLEGVVVWVSGVKNIYV